jgi:quercetin dioxygenase-like cupin family protein
MKTMNVLKRVSGVSIILLLFITSTTFAQKGDPMENSILTSIDDPDLQWGPCPPFIPEGCKAAVLHGDLAVPNTDVVFQFDGGLDLPNHWHNSAERMILLDGELEVTYAGESKRVMKKGNYAYGPAKKPHTAKCVSKKPCVLFVGFVEPVDAFAVEE